MKIADIILLILFTIFGGYIAYEVATKEPTQVKLNTIVMEDSATAKAIDSLNQTLEELLQEQKENNAARDRLLEDIRRNYYMTIAP